MLGLGSLGIVMKKLIVAKEVCYIILNRKKNLLMKQLFDAKKECGKLINVLIALIRRKFGLDFTLKRIAQQMIDLEDIVTLAQRILTKIAVTKM